MKKKFVILTLILSLATMGIFAGCSSNKEGDGGASGENTKYDFIISHLATEEDSMQKGAEYLKKQLEEKSDGRIKVKIYPNKQLASSDNEMIDQVVNNTVQMCITPNYIVASLNEDLSSPNIFDFPYMFESFDELYAFCESDIGQKINQEMTEKAGITVYGPYVPAWYKIATKKKVEKMQDLKGIKLRSTTSQMAMATLKAFGANPTPVNFGEVFTALQQGTVNGVACAGNLVDTERYYEIIDNMVDTNHVPHCLYPVYSTKWIESLPDDLKKVFEECAQDYLKWIRDYGRTVEEDTLKSLEKKMHVEYLTDEAREEFIKAGRSTYDKNADVVGGKEFLKQCTDWLEDYRAKK